MDNKQTALQWYIEKCENIKYNPLEKNGYTIAKEKIIKQALEMESEQIIDAAERWKGTNFAEQYYNETYGGKDEK